MVIRRATHALYDTQYHLVWAPKYRKKILHGELRQQVARWFGEIAEHYGIMITEMEVSEDHINIPCSFLPRHSIAQVVTRFKSLSARAVFGRFPQVKRELWGYEFWGDGYFVGTVGDRVTEDVIRKYIAHHGAEQMSNSMKMCGRPEA